MCEMVGGSVLDFLLQAIFHNDEGEKDRLLEQIGGNIELQRELKKRLETAGPEKLVILREKAPELLRL